MYIPWERAHVRVRARECRMAVCTNVRLYRRSCIEACTDAQMRTRTRASAAPSGFGCSHTLVHARMDGFINTCVYRWLGMDGRASVYLYIYIYITISISLLYIYYALTRTHVCMHVCLYGHVVHTGIDVSVCTQTDRYRWVHVCLAPSVQLNI